MAYSFSDLHAGPHAGPSSQLTLREFGWPGCTGAGRGRPTAGLRFPGNSLFALFYFLSWFVAHSLACDHTICFLNFLWSHMSLSFTTIQTGRSRGVGEVLPDLPSDDAVQCHYDQPSWGFDQALSEETRARQNHWYVVCWFFLVYFSLVVSVYERIRVLCVLLSQCLVLLDIFGGAFRIYCYFTATILYLYSLRRQQWWHQRQQRQHQLRTPSDSRVHQSAQQRQCQCRCARYNIAFLAWFLFYFVFFKLQIAFRGRRDRGWVHISIASPHFLLKILLSNSQHSHIPSIFTGSSGVDQEIVESMLLALVCRSFGKQCIVFFEMKRNAHRFCALLNLMKVKAAELHGDVTQAQRYLALERFRTQQVNNVNSETFCNIVFCKYWCFFVCVDGREW